MSLIIIIYTVIVVIIIVIIWYCKHSQKYHVSNNTQSDAFKITNVHAEAVELETNPSYGSIKKETQQQTTVDNPCVDERVDITVNPSYTPLVRSEDEVIHDSSYDYI